MSEEQENQSNIRIELRIENPHKEMVADDIFFHNISTFIQPLMNFINNFIQLNEIGLEAIIIADESKIGEAIFELQDSSGIKRSYTGQYKGYYATAGKTIAYLSNNEEVKSSVVILSNLFYEILGVMEQNSPFEEWGIDARFCFYIFVHELGHCYDNLLRKNIKEEEIDLESENNSEVLGKYYSSILISEFLASYYAGNTVTPDLQNHMIDNWREDSKKLVDDLLKRKMSFHSMAFTAASHSLWVILIQYAKLVGHKMTNKELPLCPTYYDWDSNINNIFVSLEEILRINFTPVSLLENKVHNAQNPIFDLDKLAFEKFYPIWEKLANENEFFFEN